MTVERQFIKNHNYVDLLYSRDGIRDIALKKIAFLLPENTHNNFYRDLTY